MWQSGWPREVEELPGGGRSGDRPGFPGDRLSGTGRARGGKPLGCGCVFADRVADARSSQAAVDWLASEPGLEFVAPEGAVRRAAAFLSEKRA